MGCPSPCRERGEAMKTRNREVRALALTAAAVLLSGCALTPKYALPSTEPPAAFKEGGTLWQPAHPSDALSRGPWWDIFGDPRLNELEQKVVVSNQNIKQAEAQYRQALTLVTQARANYLPTVSVQPSAT